MAAIKTSYQKVTGILPAAWKSTVMLVLTACSLPMLIVGGYLIAYWLRIHTSDVYYVDYPYLLSGLIMTCCGIFCLGITLRGIRRWSFTNPFLLIVPVLGLATTIEFPDAQPYNYATASDSSYMGNLESFLTIWYEGHHAFPATEPEFEAAFAAGRTVWQNKLPVETSHYKQRGRELPYKLVIESKAKGPCITDVSPRPGVIYYSISPDRQEFWATMTGLSSNLSNTAALRTVREKSQLTT